MMVVNLCWLCGRYSWSALPKWQWFYPTNHTEGVAISFLRHTPPPTPPQTTLDQAWMGIVSKALQRDWAYFAVLMKEMPTLHWPWTLSSSFLISSSAFLITPDLFIALLCMLFQSGRQGRQGHLKASVFGCPWKKLPLQQRGGRLCHGQPRSPPTRRCLEVILVSFMQRCATLKPTCLCKMIALLLERSRCLKPSTSCVRVCLTKKWSTGWWTPHWWWGSFFSLGFNHSQDRIKINEYIQIQA